MRIILYSDQEIPENKQVDLALVSLISDTNKEIAYVASNPEESRFYFNRKKNYYSLLGFDLKEYFDREILQSDEARNRLISYSAIHLSGGNTFEFRNWVFSLGVDKLLIHYAHSGGVLIGTSAGAILLTPDISTALLCGDIAPEHKHETNGLGLVNFYIWPHYSKTDQGDSRILSLIDDTKKLYRVPDGAGIVVRNSMIDLIGNVEY